MTASLETDSGALPASRPSIVGRNAILLLSGYLLGTTAAHIGSQSMEACTLAAGTLGIMAIGVVALRARQNQANDAHRAMRRAAILLERRVDQHVRASARTLLKMHVARQRPHEQYLTVVRASRCIP